VPLVDWIAYANAVSLVGANNVIVFFAMDIGMNNAWVVANMFENIDFASVWPFVSIPFTN
jgi:hypothetical protein